jgi:glycosyltransferase involved in cell wall biosynthesis
MRRLLAEGHGPAVDGKTTVVPNAVDTEVFTPDDGDGDDGRTILYTGNFGHAQDLENCIRAMAHLDGDARLLLVGDGDLRGRLLGLVTEYGLEGRVEIRDPVDREAVPDLLRSAAVGVATLKQSDGLRYAVPTKTYEYLACGLPVVGTAGGALEELLTDSGGGLAVQSDPESLAVAFRTLLGDAERRAEMGAAGREHVQDRYDRRAVGRHLSETLETTIR